MSNTAAGMLGFLGGLLLAAVVMLSTLMHYVSRDTDSFLRWLDNRDSK